MKCLFRFNCDELTGRVRRKAPIVSPAIITHCHAFLRLSYLDLIIQAAKGQLWPLTCYTMPD